MKVLDLRCRNGHGFEGWFASEDEFMAQNGAGLIECPLCADRIVSRLPSAPRLNLSAVREEAAVPAQPSAHANAHASWLRAVKHLLAHTEDVGAQFAEHARRIHYGEAAPRGIRGQASAEERDALRDEGIETLALPIPAALKGPVQ